MANIQPYKYQYKYRSEDTKYMWRLIRPNNVEELERMEKSLHSAYVDFDLILASMHEGLVVRTPFRQYCAMLIDAESTK